MFIGKFAQRSHPFRKLLHVSQTHLNSHGSSYVNMMNSMPTFSKFRNLISRHVLSYSFKACKAETSVNLCNGDTNMARNCERSYQVVVAATRDMGIGKDGKLPWNLPSDLRSFKELTMSTSVHGKRNAVIMGRRTWESIPPKYRPLPSRLNVVLTRAGKLEAAASREDLLVCNDLSLALKLLAEPPHSVSVEKVFIIGGGQILKEALNGPGCEAIHLTKVETDMECDTFIPQIDSLLFSPLFSSSQMVENDIRFSFVTYVRMSNSAEESCTPQSSACTFDRETAGIKALSLMKRHAELEYIKQIQDSIASGKCRR